MTESSLNRFSSYLMCKGEYFEIINQNIFRLYNRMIVPFGPIVDDYTIEEEVSLVLLKKMGGVLVRYNKPNSNQEKSADWYAVVCDKFISLENMKSKNRSEVQRGLKNCEVKRIDADFLSRNGYEVYLSAFMSYRNNINKVQSKESFQSEIFSERGFEDIVHYWGVFSNNKLIAYSKNLLFDRVEVSYSSVKFNPEYLSRYPSYALFYEMNRFYLEQEGFEYVSDGYRSLMHETNIQDYLIRKFNFKKKYLSLNVHYSSKFGVMVKFIYPFRNIIKGFDNRVDSILRQESIVRSCYE